MNENVKGLINGQFRGKQVTSAFSFKGVIQRQREITNDGGFIWHVHHEKIENCYYIFWEEI